MRSIHYERAEIDPDTTGPALGPAWIEQHGYAAATDTLRDSLRYDGWERLIAWVGTKNGAVVAQDSFSFGQTGNVGTPGGGQVYDLTTNRLIQAVIGGTTRTYAYDRAGNLVQVKEGATVVFEYRYDPLNRLVSVRRLGTLIARYGYDVLGRRIAKRVYSGASGGTIAYTRFVYHGDQVAFEADSGGTIGLRYTWDRGTDRLIGVRDAPGNHYYVVSDKLGSVRGLIRRDGVWHMSQRFGPYGALLSRDSLAGLSLKLRYGWTGREFDAETGFSYHRARYYSPELRRFVQEDPIGDAGGANRYAYVEGQVMEMIDPDGLVSVDPDGLGSRSGGRGRGRPTFGRGASGWDGFFVGAPIPIFSGFHLPSSLPGDVANANYSGGPECFHPPCRKSTGRRSGLLSFVPDYGRAQEIAFEELALHPGHNDMDDALRHAHWSYRVAEEIGLFTAWSASLGHELENWWKGGPLDEILMDLHNNLAGRTAAARGYGLSTSGLQTSPGGNGQLPGPYPLTR